MPIGLLFWILMVLWIVIYGVYNGNPSGWGTYGWVGPSLLLFILLALLGWKTFGPVLHP